MALVLEDVYNKMQRMYEERNSCSRSTDILNPFSNRSIRMGILMHKFKK
jgi:hypothetical protein